MEVDSDMIGANVGAGGAEDGAVADRDMRDELLQLLRSDQPFTDLIFEENGPVMVKLPGGWSALDDPAPPDDYDMIQLFQWLDTDWEGRLQAHQPINRTVELEEWRVRGNGYLAFAGGRKMMAIRRIPMQVPKLAATGLPPSTKMMIQVPRGMILVGGPTSSGKSTTIAALIDELNDTNAHIVTIEDPIEYVFQRRKAVFSQREVGVDTLSFAEGVREAMRQSPNVIVIGEIRDRDTAEAAFLAGESGHLVIGSVHSSSAAGTIKKMIGFFPDNERTTRGQSLAGSLVGVISQVLLPTAGRDGYALAAELLFNHRQRYSEAIAEANITRIQGLLDQRDSDDVSSSLEASLVELVRNKKIRKIDALQAVGGNASLYSKLKDISE